MAKTTAVPRIPDDAPPMATAAEVTRWLGTSRGFVVMAMLKNELGPVVREQGQTILLYTDHVRAFVAKRWGKQAPKKRQGKAKGSNTAATTA